MEVVMKRETKEERFKRIAERRVQRVLDSLRSLSQCSNKRMYTCDEDQLKKIWDAIEGALQTCKGSFKKSETEEFKL
jgi:hypothetical protein